MTTLAELGEISKARKSDDDKHRSGRYWAAGGAGGVVGGLGLTHAARKYEPRDDNMKSYAWDREGYFNRDMPQASELRTEYHEPKKGTYWHDRAKRWSYGNEGGEKFKAEKIHLHNSLKKYPGKYGRRIGTGAALFYGGAGALAAAPIIGGVNMARNRKQKKRQ